MARNDFEQKPSKLPKWNVASQVLSAEMPAFGRLRKSQFQVHSSHGIEQTEGVDSANHRVDSHQHVQQVNELQKTVNKNDQIFKLNKWNQMTCDPACGRTTSRGRVTVGNTKVP